MFWLTHVGKKPHWLTLSISLSLSVGLKGLTYSIMPSLTKWPLDYIIFPHWGQMMLDSCTGADYILENLRCFLTFWNMFLQSREPTECSLDKEREFLFWTLQNLSEFRRNLRIAAMKYVFYKTFTGLPPSTVWQLYYFRRTQRWFLCESDCSWSSQAFQTLLSRVNGNSLLQIKAIWPEGIG